MSALTGIANWSCPACGATNAAAAASCAACARPRTPESVDDVMADLQGAGVLKSTPETSAPASERAVLGGPAMAGTPGRARPMAGVDSSLPAGATMQLPSIEDLRSTGSLPGASSTGTPPAVGETTAEYPAQRSSASARRWRPSPQLVRAVPLALMGAIGAAALTWVALGQTSAVETASTAPAPSAGAEPSVLVLEARETTLGLTENNLNSVLALCFRASDNPNTECRRDYLRELGEFPHRATNFGALRADVFEVTNAWYDACVAAGGCAPRNIEACHFFSARRREIGRPVPETLMAPDRPAICVTRDEAADYCAWRGMRLPSADEWERMARAGSDRLQPWGNFWTPAILNWGERDMVGFVVAGRLDGHELSAPVDTFFDGRTTEGLYQLFGNAAEWTSDDGEGSGMGEARGGSYADDSRVFRATRAEPVPVAERRTTLGFRCVGDP